MDKSVNLHFPLTHWRYVNFVLHKCLLSSPTHFRHFFLSKSVYKFGCYSNVKGKFSKKKIKSLLLRSSKGDDVSLQ